MIFKSTELVEYLPILPSPHKIKAPGDFIGEFYQTIKNPNSFYDTSISLIAKPNGNNRRKFRLNSLMNINKYKKDHWLILFVNKRCKI